MKIYIGIIIYDDFCTKIICVTENYTLAKIEIESEIESMKYSGEKVKISTIKEIELQISGKERE